jgi:hypothetical protein
MYFYDVDHPELIFTYKILYIFCFIPHSPKILVPPMGGNGVCQIALSKHSYLKVIGLSECC